MGKGELTPKIVFIDEPIKAVGLSMRTGMKTVCKDVSGILRRYMTLKAENGIPQQRLPWEYVSLSRNFDDNSTWEYCTGHVVDSLGAIPGVFSAFEVPAGKYAVFPIRARLRLTLGLAIGRTKKTIYEKWLPTSGFAFAGHEFEYNNEKMFEANQNYIDLFVAVKEK